MKVNIDNVISSSLTLNDCHSLPTGRYICVKSGDKDFEGAGVIISDSGAVLIFATNNILYDFEHYGVLPEGVDLDLIPATVEITFTPC